MSVVIIAYPPSGGGNHLKNMLCLDKSFANSGDLNTEPYHNGLREVHSTPGRNVRPYRIDEAEVSQQDYILHGHFGELAPWRDRIDAIKDKKWILITIDSERDRYLLNKRQHKIDQWGHEYYLNEEQFYLYQPVFYQTYFTGTPETIYTIALSEYWHSDINHHKIIDKLNIFLNKTVDTNEAQVLHSQWHINNDISNY